MTKLVPPHGSDVLKPLGVYGKARQQALVKAQGLTKVMCSSREVGDIIMMGIGGFTPLDGFMNQADWQRVCDEMYLSNGVFWPIPITLSVCVEQAKKITNGAEVALTSSNGEIIAVMKVSEQYRIDKKHECQSVYKTCDEKHPGVAMVMAQPAVNLAGAVTVLSDGGFREKYGDLYKTPQQTRDYFTAKGWSRIAAFQTRNPMHRSHEYLAKIAIEVCDGVLIHSLLGQLKAGDIPADVRTEAISALIDNYFVADTVLQSGYPLDMRYAGPREALLHALFRQNYGCSHLIVGRDHAGVGDYYGAFDAHDIFDTLAKDALITKALKIDWTFWCHRCEGMASMKTCPHTPQDRLLLSGTKLRQLLSENQTVPANFSRPEVLAVLSDYYSKLKPEEKVTIKPSGHSAQ